MSSEPYQLDLFGNNDTEASVTDALSEQLQKDVEFCKPLQINRHLLTSEQVQQYANQPTPSFVHLGGRGDKHSKIMFIAYCPTKEEVDANNPFGGRLGAKLMQAVETYANLDFNTVWCTYLFKYAECPEKISKTQFNIVKDYISQEIAQVKPDYIVCLGSDVYRVLTGKEAELDQYCGSPVYYDEYKAKVTLIWSPLSILSMPEDEHNWIIDLRLSLDRHMPNAKSFWQTQDKLPTWRPNSMAELKTAVDAWIDAGVDEIAIDTEFEPRTEWQDHILFKITVSSKIGNLDLHLLEPKLGYTPVSFKYRNVFGVCRGQLNDSKAAEAGVNRDLRRLQDENSKLTARIGELTSKETSLQQKLKQSEDAIVVYKEQLKEGKTALELTKTNLAEQTAALTKENSTLKAQSAASDKDLYALHAQVETLTNNIKTFQEQSASEKSTLLEKLAKAEKSVEEANTKANTLNNELKVVKMQLSLNNQEASTDKSLLSHSQAEVDSLKEKLSSLERKLATLTSDKEVIAKKESEALKTLADLTKELETAKASIVTLESQKTELLKAKQALKSELSTLNGAKSQLDTTLTDKDKLAAENAQLLAKLKEADEAIGRLESERLEREKQLLLVSAEAEELRKVKDENSSLLKDLESKKKNLAETQKSIDSQKALLTTSENDVEVLKKSVSQLKAEKTDKDNQIAELAKKSEEMQNALTQKETECRNTLALLEKSTDRLKVFEKLQKENAELSAKLQNLQKENLELVAKADKILSDKEASFDAILKANGKKDEEIQNLAQEKQQLLDDISKLQKEVQQWQDTSAKAVVDAKQQSTAATERYDTINQQLTTKNQSVAQLEKLLSDANASEQELKEQLSALKTANESIQKQLDIREGEIKKYQEEGTQLHQEKEAALTQLKAANMEKEEKAKELSIALHDMQAKNSELEQALQAKQVETSKSNSQEVEELKRKLSEQSQIIQDQKVALTNMEAALNLKQQTEHTPMVKTLGEQSVKQTPAKRQGKKELVEGNSVLFNLFETSSH